MLDNGFKSIRENWVIFAFFLSLVVTWTQFQSRITSLEERVTVTETKLEEVSKALSTIDNKLVEIKTTLDFIKNRI